MNIDVRGFFSKAKNGLKKGVSSITDFFGTALGVELAVVVCYGFIINLLLNALLDYSFSLLTWVAWGLVYYFVAYDFPQIVDKYRKALSK